MGTETKIFLGVILATVAVIGIGVLFAVNSSSSKPITVSESVLVPADAWATGSATPKATLVEFSDFQCPACRAAEPTVEAILAKYPDTLRFVYRFFPLPQHQFGQESALAAQAAGNQGKFWQYHNQLFPNQDNFSDTFFVQLAQQLGLNVDQFKADLKSSATADRVQSDLTAGNTIGINATPTFFLNGKELTLNNFSDLETAVADAVK